ncbi:MAG: SDR family oxidoreductase, partial [Armatimonadota bacterium]
PEAEIVIGDALDIDSLTSALEGVHTAYYLIHSLLGGHKRFEQMDIQAAENFRKASDRNKLSRIIYLGALGDVQHALSKHLRSRQEVCIELMRGNAAVTALRAAIIVGSGSASFEVMEHLVRRLPIIPLPSWSETKCQPIAIRNVIAYLVGVIESPATAGISYDIGGPDILNYREMLRVFADVLGLRRLFIRMPVHGLIIYSYFISLVTPVARSIIFSLFESAANTVVCQNNDIHDIVSIKLLPYREAVLRALSREDQDRIHTRWSDAYPPAHELAIKLDEMDKRKLYIKSASLKTKKSAASLYNSFCSVGGKEGWFNTNWLWKLRGALDKILMGVGSARGRRHSTLLQINDVVDFWRVEDITQDQRLLLRAEMKLPGWAWLEFSIDANKDATNTLSVRAYYQPSGFWGKVYWYSVYPFHSLVFQDLIEQIEWRSQDS